MAESAEASDRERCGLCFASAAAAAAAASTMQQTPPAASMGSTSASSYLCSSRTKHCIRVPSTWRGCSGAALAYESRESSMHAQSIDCCFTPSVCREMPTGRRWHELAQFACMAGSDPPPTSMQQQRRCSSPEAAPTHESHARQEQHGDALRPVARRAAGRRHKAAGMKHDEAFDVASFFQPEQKQLPQSLQ